MVMVKGFQLGALFGVSYPNSFFKTLSNFFKLG